MIIMLVENKRRLYLLTLFLVTLYLAELGFILSLTPEGYSVNIYDQIGFKVIFLNIIIYLFSLVLLTNKQDKVTSLLISVILLLNYLTLMITPNMLGYYVTDRGDTLDSVGLARYIIKTHHTDPLDIYPMTFIEAAVVNSISKVKAPWIIISLVASLLFTLSTVAITRIFSEIIILKNQREHIIPILLAVSVPYYLGMYHTSFIAQYVTFAMEGIFFLSFFLYLFRGSKGFLICLLISAIFSVFGHPIMGVFNIYFLLLFTVFSLMYTPRISRSVSGILKVIIVVLLLWFIKVGLLKHYILSLKIMFETNFQICAQSIKLSERAGITHLELLKYLFIRYGDQIMLYLISLTFIILIIRMRLYKNTKILMMLIGFALSNMFTVLILIFPILKQNYNRVLGLNIGLYFAILLVGILLIKILEKNILRTVIRLTLITIYAISVMGLFLSPFVGFPFIGITNSELSGVVFMFTHQSDDYKIVDLIGESKRYSIWYYGYFETFNQNKVLYLCRLPDHFNYPKVYPIKNNQYLVKIQHNILLQSKVPYQYSHMLIPIAKFMIEPYETINTYRRVHRWSYHDLTILYCDPTVDVVYRSKELNIIMIP